MNIGLWAGFFTQTDVGFFQLFSITSSNLREGILAGVTLSLLGFLFDSLAVKTNNRVIEQINSQTVDYSLFLLGKRPNMIAAVTISAVLAIGAAVSEEIFFRGFTQKFLTEISSSPILALFISSGIFGIAHAPLDYPNVILESILGGAFGVAYIISGFNISVPIIAHIIYVSFSRLK